MPLDPLERRHAASLFPRRHLRDDGAHKVLVLDLLARRTDPVLLGPAARPHRRAVDRVLAVGDDEDLAVHRHALQRKQNR